MRGRDNTLRANGLEHQVQFHRPFSRTRTAYIELAATTGTVKSLQVSLSSLCLAISLANTSGPKSQKLHNSGFPTTCAADPSPARISATKWLLPPKHKIKHDQDKQVQKAEEKVFF